MEVTNVKLKDLPAPIDKILEFDKDGKHYLITITDNVLINLPDGTFETNIYGEICQIHCKVKTDFKLIKLYSENFEKKDVLEKFEHQVAKFIAFVETKFKDSYPGIKYKVD